VDPSTSPSTLLRTVRGRERIWSKVSKLTVFVILVIRQLTEHPESPMMIRDAGQARLAEALAKRASMTGLLLSEFKGGEDLRIDFFSI